MEHQEYTDVRHGVIANTETYAKGWSLTPKAKLNDGLFDFMCRDNCNTLTTVRLFSAAAKKQSVSSSLANYGRARRIDIKSEQPLYIQMDGDPVPAYKEFSVEVSPRYFQIIVPADQQLDYTSIDYTE